jgi:Fe-S-cluster containining protein
VSLRIITMDGQELQLDRSLGDVSRAGPIQCFQCGVCCEKRKPLIDREDASRLALRLDMSSDEFLSRYARTYGLRPRTWQLRNEGKACAFLRYHDGGLASCSVYDDRPAACRSFLPALRRSDCQEGLRRISPESILLPSDIPVKSSDLAAAVAFEVTD